MLGAHSPAASQPPSGGNDPLCPSRTTPPLGGDDPLCPSRTPPTSGSFHAYVSFSDVLKRASNFPAEVPVMFNEASPRESRRGLLAATYPLVFASPELQVAASVFLNSSFSFLGHSLYGSRPGTKPGTKKDLSSVSSVTALVDSGADNPPAWRSLRRLLRILAFLRFLDKERRAFLPFWNSRGPVFF